MNINSIYRDAFFKEYVDIVRTWILILSKGLRTRLFIDAQTELDFEYIYSFLKGRAKFFLDFFLFLSHFVTTTTSPCTAALVSSIGGGCRQEVVLWHQPVEVANAATRTRSLKTASQVGFSPALSRFPSQSSTFTDFSNCTISSSWTGAKEVPCTSPVHLFWCVLLLN